MKRRSLPGRRHFEGDMSSGVPLVLFEITHALLDAPLRLSTDMTERLTYEPLTYGTRATWRGADPATEPFGFVGVDVEWPGEIEDDGPEAQLVMSLVGSNLLQILRSFTEPATCHMAAMLSTRLDQPPEEQLLNTTLRAAEADLSAGTVSLVLGHFPLWLERFPAMNITQDRFPHLYR